jgi:hypothetical protein
MREPELNIPRGVLQQTAKHEAAHATVGFTTGLGFADSGIWVSADPTPRTGPAGAVEFFEPGQHPGEWVGALLAGPMYERLKRLESVGSEQIAVEITKCLDDSKGTAFALLLWLDQRKLTADMPLFEMTYDSASRRFRDWNEMNGHLDSPEWTLCVEFHKAFFSSLLCLEADIPVPNNEREISTIALLCWFASQTRRLLDSQGATIEALATELLTDKRLIGDRYSMSGPELESFLAASLTKK